MISIGRNQTATTATKRPEKKKFTYTIVLLQQLPREEKYFPRGGEKFPSWER